MQEAYKTLREPAARLRHLVELELPAAGAGWFCAPCGAFHECGKRGPSGKGCLFCARRSTTTALARALLSPEIAAALRQVAESIGVCPENARSINRARLRIWMIAGLKSPPTNCRPLRRLLPFSRDGCPSCPNGNSAWQTDERGAHRETALARNATRFGASPVVPSAFRPKLPRPPRLMWRVNAVSRCASPFSS